MSCEFPWYIPNQVTPGHRDAPAWRPLGRQAFAYPVTTFPAFTYQMMRYIRHIRHDLW